MKPFALAGLLHTHGVERTSRASIPGKSELQIGEMGYVGPEARERVKLKGGIWADRREAVPYGSFGFGRILLEGRMGHCELTEATRT